MTPLHMEFNDEDLEALIKRKRLEATEALMLKWCNKKGYKTPIRNTEECNKHIKEFCKEFNTAYNYILVEYGNGNDISVPYKSLFKVSKEYERELYHCNCHFYDIDHIDDLIRCIISYELYQEGYVNRQMEILIDTGIP